MLRRLATDRAVVVLPHAGKLQRFHRLSTGSGTRVVVLAEPHVFATEQPPTIPGAVQLRLPSTRNVWNSSGSPCAWCRLARCAACGCESPHSLQFSLVGFVDLITRETGSDIGVLLH